MKLFQPFDWFAGIVEKCKETAPSRGVDQIKFGYVMVRRPDTFRIELQQELVGINLDDQS